MTALGVVYGDIGTSPLYALRECFFGNYAVESSEANVLGVLSLVAWSLLVVISLKYLVFVLRADYEGEGGILALMELVRRSTKGKAGGALLWSGLFGAALLYGDGMITPAISVLSAVEGLEVVAADLGRWVPPVTIAILVGLFSLQRIGTAGVGRLFGPVMFVWFASLAAFGAVAIARHPAVLWGLDPRYAVAFFARHGLPGLTILGIVFLVVTGGEALYADIGHFGKAPIRQGWYVLVLPALLTNYFGQGALILARRGRLANPFYELVPEWALVPMVVLATLATVIASQAIISGAFSLTYQAMQLRYLPRLSTYHMSEDERGQIYIPAVNWLLLAATVGLVLGFRRSGALAAAYGVAIAATMVVTTSLLYFALRRAFGWGPLRAGPLCALFLAVDLGYFAANMLKFIDGGWFPLSVAAVVLFLMATWHAGQRRERQALHGRALQPVEFLHELGGGGAYRRVPGQAVYLSSNPTGTPRALVQNLEHNRALHNRVVLLTLKTDPQPRLPEAERVQVEVLRDDIYRVLLRSGYLQRTDVPELLGRASREHGMGLDLEKVTYFVGQEFRIPSRELGMGLVRSRLYAFIAHNEPRLTQQFNLPPEQVVELGIQLRV